MGLNDNTQSICLHIKEKKLFISLINIILCCEISGTYDIVYFRERINRKSG